MFLGRRCPALHSTLGARWAARTQGGGTEVDAGCSLPLSVSPTGAILWGADNTSVQSLIGGWALQAEAHAMTTAPAVLAIQMGRFCSDQERPVGKLQHYIIPDREVFVPVFQNGLDTIRACYHLSSFLTHRGDTPSTGHYRAILHYGGTFYLADDAHAARPCTSDEADSACTESYLFFYCRSSDRD